MKKLVIPTLLMICLTVKAQVSDIEGNLYDTLTIGTQTWMTKNLNVTKYRNGDLIGTTNPATLDISNELAPKYQWSYAGNETNTLTYGRLYTWYVVNDSRGICPTGWHVPTFDDWETFQNYLIAKGYNYDGTMNGDRSSNNKIGKALASTVNWTSSPNAGSIGNTDYPEYRNKTGFTALPGGARETKGLFYDLNGLGYFWNATEFTNIDAYSHYLTYLYVDMRFQYTNKGMGFSVRCMKDKNLTQINSMRKPSCNIIIQKNNLVLTNLKQNSIIKISDLSGKEIYTTRNYTTELNIDINCFKQGLYILKIQSDKKYYSYKFIKTKD